MAQASVIIIHFKYDQLTTRLLACLDAHQKQTPSEVIVVDNGSPNPFQIPNLAQLRSVRVVRLETGLGFGGACQAGINAVSSENRNLPYIILNNDLSFEEDLVAGLLRSLQKYPKAGLIGPKLVFPDGEFQLSWGDDLNLKSEKLERARQSQMRLRSGTLYDSRKTQSIEARKVDWISGAAFLITPQALKAIGGLENGYFFYFEDCDWCRRVREFGGEVWYEPAVKVVHDLGASTPKSGIAHNPRALLFHRCRELGHLRYYARFNSTLQFLGLKFLLILKALKNRDCALALRLILRSRLAARTLPAAWL